MRSVLLALVRAAGVTLQHKGASDWSCKFLVLVTITMLPLVQARCTPSQADFARCRHRHANVE
jgi:hypothetical protein